MSVPNAAQLKGSFLGRLAPPVREAVKAAASNGLGCQVYLVAGALRDLLLHRPIHDIDLAVEGDAIDLAGRVFPQFRRTAHARFRTATVRVERVRIDLATARTETYARHGALPTVTPSSIVDDLGRRDFSVNAIALRLSGEPRLIDPHGGIDDLTARRVRVLHDESFRDDATRMFRALRYAARLGFELEPHTRQLLARDLAFVEHIGGERLRRELELMLGESTAGEALQAANDAGLLRAVHPSLAWTHIHSATFDESRRLAGREPLGFALLAADATDAGADAIAARLRLKRGEAAAVRGLSALRGSAHLLHRREAKPSGVVLLLDRFPLASVAAFAGVAGDEIAAALALRYLDEWRHITAQLRGDDLIAMGVPAGPQVQRGLQLVRAARLDGTVRDLADERALALRFVNSIKDSNAMTAQVELSSNGY